MVKILIAEDNKTNSTLLKLLIEEYSKDNFESYSIDIAENGFEALGMAAMKRYDVLFLDVKMPKQDGIEFLIALENLTFIHKPYICMATSFGEHKDKLVYNLRGANAYIIKPVKKNKLQAILDKALEHKKKEIKVLDIKELIEEVIEDEDFFDFDDEFLDPEEQMKIECANETHSNVSAQEFLKEINIEVYEDILEDIDDLNHCVSGKITASFIITNKFDVVDLVCKYSTFLNNFAEFYEISYSLNSLKKLITDLNLEYYSDKHQDYIANYISALLEDIYKWKTQVFNTQDTIDVNYINASALSNCIQLQNFLNKEYIEVA